MTQKTIFCRFLVLERPKMVILDHFWTRFDLLFHVSPWTPGFYYTLTLRNGQQSPRLMTNAEKLPTSNPSPNPQSHSCRPLTLLSLLICPILSSPQLVLGWNYTELHKQALIISTHSPSQHSPNFFFTSKNPIKVKILRVLRLSAAIVKSRCPWRLTG